MITLPWSGFVILRDGTVCFSELRISWDSGPTTDHLLVNMRRVTVSAVRAGYFLLELVWTA
jgi:hypothetical protein